MRQVLLALGGLILVGPAFAQSQPPPQQVDQRIAAPMIGALRAEAALRDEAIKALAEDAAKREAEWTQYSKSLWQSLPEGK
jgi:hypothetical protein